MRALIATIVAVWASTTFGAAQTFQLVENDEVVLDINKRGVLKTSSVIEMNACGNFWDSLPCIQHNIYEVPFWDQGVRCGRCFNGQCGVVGGSGNSATTSHRLLDSGGSYSNTATVQHRVRRLNKRYPMIVHVTIGGQTSYEDVELISCKDPLCLESGSRSLGGGAGFSLGPAMNEAPNGDIIIAWTDDPGNVHIVRCYNIGCTNRDEAEPGLLINLSGSWNAFDVIVDASNRPALAYCDQGTIYFVRCGDSECVEGFSGAGQSVGSTVTSGATSCNSVDLRVTLGVEGYPIIVWGSNSYADDNTAFAVKCLNRPCSQSVTSTLPFDGFENGISQIVIGADGLPAFVVGLEGDSGLVNRPTYVHCDDHACSNATVVDLSEATGQPHYENQYYTELVLTDNLLPMVVYTVQSVQYALFCADSLCSSYQIGTLYDPGFSGGSTESMRSVGATYTVAPVSVSRYSESPSDPAPLYVNSFGCATGVPGY